MCGLWKLFPVNKKFFNWKNICSQICLDKDKKSRYQRMRKSKREKGKIKCLYCDNKINKDQSFLTYKIICSDNCLSKHKKLLNYGTNLKIDFWLKQGLSKKEAKEKISNLQKQKSPLSIEYWVKKGFSDEEAKERISKIQKERNLKKSHDRSNNIFCKEYWIKKGYDENIAIKIAKEKANTISLKSFINRYGKKKGRKKYINFVKTLKNKSLAKNIINKKGKNEYINIMSKRCGKNSSKIAIKIFQKYSKYFPNNKIYFYPKSKEFLIFDGNACYFYDFVITDLKYCVELNGEYWHRDPKIYFKDQIINGVKSEDIWIKDRYKKELLLKKGYTVEIVWYLKNKKFRYNEIIFNNINELIESLWENYNEKIKN